MQPDEESIKPKAQEEEWSEEVPDEESLLNEEDDSEPAPLEEDEPSFSDEDAFFSSTLIAFRYLISWQCELL